MNGIPSPRYRRCRSHSLSEGSRNSMMKDFLSKASAYNFTSVSAVLRHTSSSRSTSAFISDLNVLYDAKFSNLRRPKIHQTRALSNDSHSDQTKHVIILGAGIAGISTARYLLEYTKQRKNINVTIIDRNIDAAPERACTYSNYHDQQMDLPHFNIPSRRNGNMLCPSLTIPWTKRSLWYEAFLPVLKSYWDSNSSAKHLTSPPISFDWSNLISDASMWSFARHYLLQKYFIARSEHESNESILKYSMQCLDDASDYLIQNIDYGRCARGTKLLDGSIVTFDSSGDIGLFRHSLMKKLIQEYSDRLTLISGEEAVTFEVDGAFVRGVTCLEHRETQIMREADVVVVACGVESTALCNSINVTCPVFPAKGHLATVASSIQCEYNITLERGVGFAAPIASIDPSGKYLYRLSGFVDFTPNKEVNVDRIDALLSAARVHLPDLELIDASACHRPLSADDRPIVGPSEEYSNLFLLTGLGSRGWTVGLGCGKLLARQILRLSCEVDPAPYLPNRFNWN